MDGAHVDTHGAAMLPGWNEVRANLPCVCNEPLDALSERALVWDCVPSDLSTLAGTGEGSVGLVELVGDALRDDVADLVRGGRGESPQLLEGEKLLFGRQEIRVCCGRQEGKRVDLRSPAPFEGLWPSCGRLLSPC